MQVRSQKYRFIINISNILCWVIEFSVIVLIAHWYINVYYYSFTSDISKKWTFFLQLQQSTVVYVCLCLRLCVCVYVFIMSTRASREIIFVLSREKGSYGISKAINIYNIRVWKNIIIILIILLNIVFNYIRINLLFMICVMDS
jgi:hypothetical protein